MKVLVILPDVVLYGGTTCFLERLLKIHVNQEIKTVLLVSQEQQNLAVSALAKRYKADLINAPNRIKPETPPAITPFFDLLFSWTTVRLHRPDLIVVSTAAPGRFSIALYFPFPALYILHSVPERHFRLLPRWYMRIGSMLRNRIMTVSRTAADAISETMGIPRTCIEVVHNSCSVGERGIEDSGKSIVLTVGHLVDYKNPWLWLDIACKVLTRYPDSQFVWLGDGELLEPFRNKVKQLSLEKRILLPGYIENPSSWYLSTSVYLQPSIRESHGIAVLEAMSYGLPCVVANTGGLPESVVDGETGYVCSINETACFAGAIINLLDDLELRTRMGNAGRQRVKSCFSQELQEEKLMSLYRSLVHQAAW